MLLSYKEGLTEFFFKSIDNLCDRNLRHKFSFINKTIQENQLTIYMTKTCITNLVNKTIQENQLTIYMTKTCITNLVLLIRPFKKTN